MRSNICQTFVTCSQPIASTGLSEATFIWEASFIKGSLWTILSAKFGDKTDRLLEHHLANKPFQPQTWQSTGARMNNIWLWRLATYFWNLIDQNHKRFRLQKFFHVLQEIFIKIHALAQNQFLYSRPWCRCCLFYKVSKVLVSALTDGIISCKMFNFQIYIQSYARTLGQYFHSQQSQHTNIAG